MRPRDSRGRFVSDAEAKVDAILQAAIRDAVGAIRVNGRADGWTARHLAETTYRADLLLAGEAS